MIRLVILMVVLIVALLFALENGDPITIRMFFGAVTPPVPVYLVILASFGLGVAVTALLIIPEWIRARLELRRQRRRIAALEERLSIAEPSAPSSAPLTPPRLFPDDVA